VRHQLRHLHGDVRSEQRDQLPVEPRLRALERRPLLRAEERRLGLERLLDGAARPV
jgi:hypothetical protein